LRSSSFAWRIARLRAAGRFRPALFSKKVSIDIADLKGELFRRALRSDERLSDSAIARGLRVKTPRSRTSALLRSVTAADQRFGAGFDLRA
jgi:energy-coupling factor transporter transmembrane protein EcfT